MHINIAHKIQKKKRLPMKEFIKGLPKAELHLHIEGSFEPELMFEIAKRNNCEMRFKSVEEVRAAYDFNNLQEFLDIYYEGANVLLYEQDFYDLTWAYMERIASQNVIHTEIFFDPQTHTHRGVAFKTVIGGIWRAMEDAREKLGITSHLIMCFLRHLSEDEAFITLEQALPFKDRILGVGLDSSEVGHPPSKFERVFARAKEHGFLAVAHAGEEGPAEYVEEAMTMLNIDRIDHGNRCLDDETLVDTIVNNGVALTVCPLSNLKLAVVKDLKDHPLKTMLEKGLKATVNSDDPAYFGGYMNENFIAIQEALDLTKEDIKKLAANAFEASFVNDNQKQAMLEKLNSYCAQHGC